MAAKIARLAGLCGMALVLASCGIAIEVAEPLPTPTSDPVFVNPVIWGGDVVHVQATPRISFADSSDAQIELFVVPVKAATLLDGNSLYLPIYFNVTWYGSPQSTVQLTLNVFTRTNERVPWTLIDSDSRTFSTVEVPFIVDDEIGVGVFAETVGKFDVRVEISAVIRREVGTIVTRESTQEFTTYVLPIPEEVSTDSDLAWPFGDLPTDIMLYDPRGWLGGPCTLVDGVDEDAQYALVDACSAAENEDISAMIEALTEAARTSTNSEYQANIEGMRGLLLVHQRDFDQATIAFSTAALTAREAGLTHLYMILLHNLLTTYLMRGEAEQAEVTHFTLLELQGQFPDEIGDRLTNANLGKWYEDYGRMDEPYSYFFDKGMPQADVLGFWLNK